MYATCGCEGDGQKQGHGQALCDFIHSEAGQPRAARERVDRFFQRLSGGATYFDAGGP